MLSKYKYLLSIIMSVNLGINGFGRIGRLVLRAAVENNKPVYTWNIFIGDSQSNQWPIHESRLFSLQS